MSTYTIASDFETSYDAIIALRDNEATVKAPLNQFKKGDILACFAGHSHSILCIVELSTDKVDFNNIEDCITDRSLVPMTSHVISNSWFKIN